MIVAHRKKGHSITLGAICLIIGIVVSFQVGTDKIEKGFWAPLAIFVIGCVVMICLAFRSTPVIEITEHQIFVEGTGFDRSNIRCARVLRMFLYTCRGRFMELGFHEMPGAAAHWKGRRPISYPTQCENGVKFVMEPMVIIPICDTDLSDERAQSCTQ